jgi:vacuolar protein sorting-associated protein 52
MAAVFPQRKEQLVFLINNLDLVLTVHAVRNLYYCITHEKHLFKKSCLQEHTREGAREVGSARDESRREIVGFRDHLSTRSAEYVEEVLRPHFGACMQFVKEGEAIAAKGRLDDFKRQESKARAMLKFQLVLTNAKIFLQPSA